MDKIISSSANPLIKDISKLINKSSYRHKQEKIVVDGLREIKLALEFSYEPLLFLVRDDVDERILSDFKEIIVRVSSEALEKAAYKENPDGYIGIFRYKLKGLEEIKLSDNPLVVVLDSLEKPGNLGAILRTAYAAGVDAVICNDLAVDIYNPNIIRASTGRVFSRQVAVASIDDTDKWLKNHQIETYVASIQAQDSYADKDYRRPSAFVFGSEAWGIGKEWEKKEAEKIIIPMKENIDSLNVSVSVGIVVFEALRQRGFKF